MANSFKLSMHLGASLGGSVRSTFSGAEGQLNRLGSSIRKFKDQQKSIRSFSINTANVKKAQASLLTARRELAGFNSELKKNARPTKKLAANIQKAQKKVERLSQSLNTQQSRLQRTRESLKSAGLSTGNLSHDNERLGLSVERLNTRYRQLGRTMEAQRKRAAQRQDLRGQIFDTAAVGFAVAAPLKIAIDFEADVTRLGAVTRTDGKVLDSLRDKARELGEETLFSASDTVGAMNFLGMAGFESDEILSATPGVLNLAQAAGQDLGRTADVASNILSGFGLEADQMDRLGDVLAETFTRTNTNLSMLGETMKFVAPVAAASGASIEQVAAMAGKLGDAGIQGGRAGTVLRASFLRLSAPTGVAADALGDLGIKVEDDFGNLRSVPLIFEDIAESMQDMGSVKKTAMIKQIFGEEAASGVTQLLGVVKKGDLSTFIDILEAADANDTAKKLAERMANTTRGALQLLGASLESVAISVGSTLLPVIKFSAKMFASMASNLSKLSQKFPLVTTVVAGAVVGLIALKIATLAAIFSYSVMASAVGTLGTVYTFFTSALGLSQLGITRLTVMATLHATRIAFVTTVQGAWNAAMTWTQGLLVRLNVIAALSAARIGLVTAAQWAWNLALTANPIGLIIVGIGALIGLGVVLVKNWGKVKIFFASMWESVKKMTGSAVKWLIDNINLLLNPFALISKVVTTIGGMLLGDEETDSSEKPASQSATKKMAKTAALGTALVGATALSAPLPTAELPDVSVANTVQQTQHVKLEAPITINTAPGADAEAIGLEVQKHLELQQLHMEQRQRAALFDLP